MLGIDTATAVAAVGVYLEDRVLADRSVESVKGHAEALPGLVARALEDAGIEVADLGAVAVSAGPGSFTGIRLGLGFGRGLAFAAGIPLVSVPTLDALAAAVPAEDGALAVCLDARKGEVYLALYRRTGSLLAREGDVAALSPEVAATRIAIAVAAGGRVAGDALEAHSEAFSGLGVAGIRRLGLAEAPPRGSEVARLGRSFLASGAEGRPERAMPIYLSAAPRPQPTELRCDLGSKVYA